MGWHCGTGGTIRGTPEEDVSGGEDKSNDKEETNWGMQPDVLRRNWIGGMMESLMVARTSVERKINRKIPTGDFINIFTVAMPVRKAHRHIGCF